MSNRLNLVPLILEMKLDQIPDNLQLEKVRNPLGGSSSENYFGKIRINENEWFIDYDQENELWWVNPRPEGKFYEILYTKLFYSSPLPEQFGYASLEIDGTRRSEKAIKNWDDIEKNIKIQNKSKLLEIGCGPGEFLLEAMNRGWVIVVGNELEMSSALIAESKGLQIDTGFFENFHSNEGFDMLFADNVIEHTMDPLLFLQHAYSLTNTGGLIVLRLPDTQSFGPTLKLIDHTFHFTRKSIAKILEKAGYSIETIFYSGTFKGNDYERDNKQRIENMTVIARRNS